MIEVSVHGRRKSLLIALTEIVEPPPRVATILAFDGRIVLPITYAKEFYEWMCRSHAIVGLGFHDILWGFETNLNKMIYALGTHPALVGHGMLGRRNNLPISCWKHGESNGVPQCNIDGIGIEGFLVPQDVRFDGSRDHYTFWAFSKMSHGLPRLRQSMFFSSFGNGNTNEKDSFAAKKAAERKTKYGN